MTAEGKKEILNVPQARLFNFRPIFFAAVFLSFGIVFAYLHAVKSLSSVWLVALLSCGAFTICFCRRRADVFRRLSESAIVGVAFFCGFFGCLGQLSAFTNAENLSGERTVVGYIVEKRVYTYGNGLVLDGLTIDGRNAEGRMIVYVSSSFGESLSLADRVVLDGTVELQNDYVDKYGFRASDIGDNLVYTAQAVRVTRAGRVDKPLLRLRERIGRTLDEGMDETTAAVMKAVLLGERSGIEAELYDNIRMGGIAHIFAVSGLHVGAFFAFCLLLFSRTPLRALPKVCRFLLLTGVLLLYAGICGFGASVVRATVMCLCGYACNLLFFKKDLLESIAMAAIVVLFLSPCALFEVGFQLSFAACLGIAFFAKRMGQVFDECCIRVHTSMPWRRGKAEENADVAQLRIGARLRRGATEFLGVTLSAQLASSPLLLYYFGYLSGWSLLLNCLFVPMIGGVFSCMLLLALLAAALPFFARGILYVPNVFWSLALLLFQVCDFTSFALQGVRLSVGAIVCYYAALLFCTDKFNLSRRWRRALFGVLCAAFCLCVFACNS